MLFIEIVFIWNYSTHRKFLFFLAETTASIKWFRNGSGFFSAFFSTWDFILIWSRCLFAIHCIDCNSWLSILIFFCTWAFLEYSQSLAAQLQWRSTEPRVQQRGRSIQIPSSPTLQQNRKRIIKGWLTVKISMDEDEEENTLHCWRDDWMLSLFRTVVWTCDNCNLNLNVSYWRTTVTICFFNSNLNKCSWERPMSIYH